MSLCVYYVQVNAVVGEMDRERKMGQRMCKLVVMMSARSSGRVLNGSRRERMKETKRAKADLADHKGTKMKQKNKNVRVLQSLVQIPALFGL